MKKLLLLFLLIPITSYSEKISLVCELEDVRTWKKNYTYDSAKKTLKDENENPFVMKCKKDDWEMICKGREPWRDSEFIVYVTLNRKDLSYRHDTWTINEGQQDDLVATLTGQCRILENQL